MFWRKKKTAIETFPSDILTLAARLGVERRVNVRVRYPNQSHVCKLPEIGLNGHKFHVQDISVGGCCLLDPAEILGPAIGENISLDITWTTGTEPILARIVSRVDERRHIQFLNLGDKRQELLKRFMAFGVRGLAVRNVTMVNESNLQVMAAEIWTSLKGDSIFVFHDPHRVAQMQLADDEFTLFKNSWPLKTTGAKCSKVELEQLVLFLTNVHKPSPALKEILFHLEDLLWSNESVK